MKILIGCDVDPVLPEMLDRRPGGDVWECLQQVDRLLDCMGEEMPPVTWLLRADQSVEFATGSFASGYSEHPTLWDKLQKRSHELGWHMHTMSYAPSRQQFVFDPAPAWLAQAHESLVQFFPVKATRTGWDYGSNQLFSALDRLGIAVDFSALPGNRLWFSAGAVRLVTDWRNCPIVPYHPGGHDYRRVGPEPLTLWEVPAAQFRHSAVGTLLRGLLRLRHGCFSMSGFQNRTQLFTDQWHELPHQGSDVWAFFFHPYDLTETGIRNFQANVRRLQKLPNIEFTTATEVSTWLSSCEHQSRQ